jgi:hypothetical protein
MSPHVHGPVEEEFVVVFAGDRQEAWIVAGALTAQEIDATLDPPDPSNALGTALDLEIKVLVPSSQADQARQLIAEHRGA